MNIETIKNLLLLEKDEDILTELQKMKSADKELFTSLIMELKETNNSIFNQIVHRTTHPILDAEKNLSKNENSI